MRFRLAAAIAYLGALNVFGFGGPAALPVRTAGSLFAILLAAVLAWNPAPGDRRFWCAAAVAACAAGVAMLPGPVARGTCLAFALAAVPGSGLAGAWAGLMGATAGFAAAGFLPGVAEVGTWAATGLAGRFQAGDGAPQLLGPSAASIPAAMVALLLLASRARRGGSLWPWLGMAGVIAALGAQWWLGFQLEAHFGGHAGHDHPHAPGNFANVPPATALMAGAVCLGWGGHGPSRPVRGVPRSATGLAAGLVLGGLAALVLGGWRGQGAPDRRIAVLNVGGLDWERPSYQELGIFSGGMFGLLPLYLQQAGWRVESLDEGALPGFDRRRAQILILINCHRHWTAEERARLEAFLGEGGSLLVLGDHTDVFGLMRGFDTLLAPWGIGFQFDSAYHHGANWEGNLEWRPGDLGLWRSPDDAGIGIGSSLRIEWPARPVIQARYAFADAGVRENVPGSFLGNYTYDRGERLGDLVVAASRRIGRGQVLVYGDTSGFQNGSLGHSFTTHVEPILRRLARPARLAVPPWLETAIALAVLLAGLAGLLWPGRTGRTGVTAGAAVILALAVGQLLGGSRLRLDEVDLSRSLLIDDSLFPNLGHYEAGWNSIGALETCAQRSGLTVHRQSAWDARAVRRARVVTLVAPRRPLAPSQLRDLDEAMANGATVLALGSSPHARGLRSLLAAHGLAVAPASLGPIPPPARQQEHEPRFVDPSAILAAAGTTARSLYRYGELDLAVAVPVGAGWLVVLGDTRFFSDGNVEGVWGWWGGNLRFIHDLFALYGGGDAERVATLLPAPIRPEE